MMDLWRIYEGFMEDLCRIYGGFMMDLWRIYGGFMEDLWRIYGGFRQFICEYYSGKNVHFMYSFSIRQSKCNTQKHCLTHTTVECKSPRVENLIKNNAGNGPEAMHRYALFAKSIDVPLRYISFYICVIISVTHIYM